MAKSKNTIESRIDYSILLPVLILLLVGLVSIFIATNFDYPKNLVQVMSQQPLLSYNFCTGNDVFSDVVELEFQLAREEGF